MAPDYQQLISTHRPKLDSYEQLYKHLHSHPELSLQESDTASLIASHLRTLSSDLDIRTSIGGHGLIAILRNGSGPAVLLRADFDALPIREKTGLEYASKVEVKDESDGLVKPVMHACGHDFHVAAMLAAVETLVGCRGEWEGTLIALFQPAEEKGLGAKAMVEDGLYKDEKEGGKGCPIPDFVLGQHVFPLEAGVGKFPTSSSWWRGEEWQEECVSGLEADFLSTTSGHQTRPHHVRSGLFQSHHLRPRRPWIHASSLHRPGRDSLPHRRPPTDSRLSRSRSRSDRRGDGRCSSSRADGECHCG